MKDKVVVDVTVEDVKVEDVKEECAKRDYLIRTFSRTKRKDYENYILTAIWHKLGRMDIQPVTQQYIKRADGRYALVDLYFPQLHIAIECDETHHIANAELDSVRTLKMKEALAAYDEMEDFELIRIPAYESIMSIEENIAKAVETIKEKISEKISEGIFKAWDSRPAVEVARDNKLLRVEDRLSFRTIADICRCFGKDNPPIRTGYFPIGHDYQFWGPHFYVDAEDNPLPNNGRCTNSRSDDWEHIFQENAPDHGVRKDRYSSCKRITFARSKDALGEDAYRFIGVYENDDKHKKTSDIVKVSKRIATEIELTLWLGN